MPISGLVLTLDPTDTALARVRRALSSDPRLTLGPALGCKLPIVTETCGPAEAQALVEQLMATPGVSFVDVAFVDLSTDPEP